MRHIRQATIVLFLGLIGIFSVRAAEPGQVDVCRQDHTITLANARLRVDFDLQRGTYLAVDRQRNRVIISGAHSNVAGFASNAPGVTHTVAVEPLADALGMGRSLLVTSTVPGGPRLLLRISLYNDATFLVMSAGVENSTDQVLQVKQMCPLGGRRGVCRFRHPKPLQHPRRLQRRSEDLCVA